MNHGDKPSCVLCQLASESPTTGPLSTKDDVTAHQNCLLFSSGIYCQNSPQYDDLFGFSVEDVLEEVRRGSELICSRCKKRGATAGCEVRHCKKSFHYPCAVKAQAKPNEDAESGKYWLYCARHHEKMQRPQNNGHVNGLASSCTKPTTSKNATEAGVSKRQLCFGDQQEEVPSKPKKRRTTNRIQDDSSNSDDNEHNTSMQMFAPLESDSDEIADSFTEHQLPRHNIESPTGSTSGNHLESSDGNKDEDATIIHSDTDSESLLLPVIVCNESQEFSATRAEHSTQTRSTTNPNVLLIKTEDVEKTEDGGGAIDPSLLELPLFSGTSSVVRPVHSPEQHTAGPSVPQQSSAGPSPSPDHSKPHSIAGSPPCTSSAISPAPPEAICVSCSPFPPPVTLTSEPERSIDSTSFWKSCNTAGCTRAMFADFINQMNDISNRILSDQANQEDYDCALKVMTASGKLAGLVAKQQEELQRKQSELAKAAAAMKELISALGR